MAGAQARRGERRAHLVLRAAQHGPVRALELHGLRAAVEECDEVVVGPDPVLLEAVVDAGAAADADQGAARHLLVGAARRLRRARRLLRLRSQNLSFVIAPLSNMRAAREEII